MQTLQSISTALRKGELTSVALTERAIANHRRTKNWNAYKTWAPGEALAAAEVADGNFKRGADRGLLQGIPVSVKDIFGVDNLPTFAGTRRELPAAWRRQGFVVNRVRDSLGVVTGKTHTVDELQSGGMKTAHLSLPEVDQARALLAQGSVAAAQCAEFVRAELPAWLTAMDPLVSLRIHDGGEISALEYLSRHRQLRKLATAAAACFTGFTVLACPTVRISPPRVIDVATVAAYRPRNMAALANTCFANMMRLCAVTIPAGLDRNGMPVGLQMLAPHNEEELLLAVAARAEEILGAPDSRIGKPPPSPEVRT